MHSESNDSFPLDEEVVEAKHERKEVSEERADPTLPSINESWYTYWGLGTAFIKYPGEAEDLISDIKSLGGKRHVLVYDLLGFYWPLENKTSMLGFVFNGASDNIELKGVEVTIRQIIYGLSGMHFFGPNIGSGWFLRGDAGIARYSVELSGSPGNNFLSTSKTGFGFLLGGGYALPISPETRLLINGNFALRSVKGEKINTTAFSLGLLF